MKVTSSGGTGEEGHGLVFWGAGGESAARTGWVRDSRPRSGPVGRRWVHAIGSAWASPNREWSIGSGEVGPGAGVPRSAVRLAATLGVPREAYGCAHSAFLHPRPQARTVERQGADEVAKSRVAHTCAVRTSSMASGSIRSNTRGQRVGVGDRVQLGEDQAEHLPQPRPAPFAGQWSVGKGQTGSDEGGERVGSCKPVEQAGVDAPSRVGGRMGGPRRGRVRDRAPGFTCERDGGRRRMLVELAPK